MVHGILLPVDGSKYMERNVGYACDLARKLGSELTMIHVVTLPSPSLVEPEAIDLAPLEQAGLNVLEKAKEIAESKGAAVRTKLETTQGNPAQRILEVAESGRYDLITLGAKGHSLIRNLTVGSVCDTVVRNAPCPVLVIH